MPPFFEIFKIKDREKYENTISNITKGVEFRGTNLWILIFAIFIASLGLNLNATAVIIGAMLISPLMGPIMGMGLGMGINDLALFKTAAENYAKAIIVGLLASTVYFLLSPLNEAHSEILSRVSPSIYDVLIALFGGLAGILATSTTLKGNVIPGVAIATALMPPLCTAGFGLANANFNYLFGALYLLLINTVFIALSTLVTVRLLKFPFRHLPDKIAEKRAQRYIILIVALTLLPSLYFGYDLVSQNTFIQNANRFVDAEAQIKDDIIFNKKIDPKGSSITLTYVGKPISDSAINRLKGKMKYYSLGKATTLQVQQGLAYLTQKNNTATEENTAEMGRMNEVSRELDERTRSLAAMQAMDDSTAKLKANDIKVFGELQVLFPQITGGFIHSSYVKQPGKASKNIISDAAVESARLPAKKD